MIVVHHGVRPFTESWHLDLYRAYAERVAVIFIDPSCYTGIWRGGRDRWTSPYSDFPDPPPNPGFTRVEMAASLPLRRIDAISVRNREMGVRRTISRLRRIAPEEPLVFINSLPGRLSTLDRVPADLRVYDVRDDYAALVADPSLAPAIEAAHRRMLESADLVMAISARLAESARRIRPDCHLTDMGVNFRTYDEARAADAPEVVRNIPGPRIGLVANLDDRIDWELIAAVANAHPHANVVVVGPIYRASEGTARKAAAVGSIANVHLVGRLPVRDIPATTAAFDCCVIPYRDTASVQSINPLKFFQYLAAGKQVVATPIPALKPYSDLACMHAEKNEFVLAVSHAISRPQEQSDVARRKEVAKRHDWHEIVDTQLHWFEAALGGLPARPT